MSELEQSRARSRAYYDKYKATGQYQIHLDRKNQKYAENEAFKVALKEYNKVQYYKRKQYIKELEGKCAALVKNSPRDNTSSSGDLEDKLIVSNHEVQVLEDSTCCYKDCTVHAKKLENKINGHIYCSKHIKKAQKEYNKDLQSIDPQTAKE